MHTYAVNRRINAVNMPLNAAIELIISVNSLRDTVVMLMNEVIRFFEVL